MTLLAILVLLTTTIAHYCVFAIDPTPVIHTTTGPVTGTILKSHSSVPIRAYYGIPYALPPVGPLRFLPPVPVNPWNYTLEAIVKPNSCPQPPQPGSFPGSAADSVWYANTPIKEDCLYLNIWVPENIKQKQPILLWLHGGALFFGTSTSDVFQGEKLAAETGLIIASMQYRLGPLGFLYLDSEEAPGNVGLLDQVLAMRWLKENAEVFGGDSDRITLFGESAGGASIMFHLLSHHSRTLFNSGIVMSGTVESRFQPARDAMNSSLELAKVVGCFPSDETHLPSKKDLVACLRSIPSQELVLSQMKHYHKALRSPFVATVDGDFLKDTPRNLLKSGDVKRAPLLIGNVQDEGTFFMPGTFPKMRSMTDPANITHDELVDYIQELFKDRTSIELEAILQEYSNHENPDDGYGNQKLVASAAGDAYLICPSRNYADGWSRLGLATYYYLFSHRTLSSLWSDWYGVRHTDEIEYVFGTLPHDTHSEEEISLSKRMMELFSNFARDGKPDSDCEWEMYTVANPKFMRLETGDWNLEYGPRARQCSFWNGYLPKLKEEFQEKRCGIEEVTIIV